MIKISDVAIDSIKFAKENPVRTSIYGTVGTVGYSCCKNNPDSRTYTDQLKQAQNELSMIYSEQQNPISKDYLKYIETCRNNDTLRILSLGLFSIVWIDDKASYLATPDATCKYLEPAYLTFQERIIDVGFWNRWYSLNKHMKDYDVNF